MDIKNEKTWLMHGDCLERMKEIPDCSVDMVLADPPYGTTACKWDSIIPLEPMWEHLKRVIKPNGAIVMTASQPFTTTLIASNMNMFKYCWFWKKSRPSGHLNAKKMPLRDIEEICVFYKNLPTYKPQGLHDCTFEKVNTEKRRKNGSVYSGCKIKNIHIQTKTGYPRQVLDIPSAHNVGTHPTQKPVALMEYLILTYTNEGDTVLDFTMGSGTTGVACIKTERKFIGIEMDGHYFDVASKRIAEA